MSPDSYDNSQIKLIFLPFYNEINHNQISSHQNEDGHLFQVEKM